MARSVSHKGALWCLLAILPTCTPARYALRPVDMSHRLPLGVQVAEGALAPGASMPRDSRSGSNDEGGQGEPTGPVEAPESTEGAAPEGPLTLDAVLASVTSRYPPYLSALLERDIASGRLQKARGGFDTNLSMKVKGTLQGFYESTYAQGLVEQPLATGDSVYGGYRVSEGFLPDYYSDRTQDGGEFVVGGRFPLLRDRSIDGRRAGVRQAEIDAALVVPTVTRARIDFIRAASRAYFEWDAAGRQLSIAEALLALATDRKQGLEQAVARQFLAPIDVIDNERLIAQRQVFVVQAERRFQASALALSLFLRDEDDRPIVAGESNLAPIDEDMTAPDSDTLETDVELALKQRPELRRYQLLVDRLETERRLADNRMLPNLDLLVEGTASSSSAPYKDIEDLELYVGGELKLPLQRRSARGELAEADAKLQRLRLEASFARDQVINELVDARSALRASRQQLVTSRRNVDLALQVVDAEQRRFELGSSDLLRIQLREVQLADAQNGEIEAHLRYRIARVNYRAAIGKTD